MKFERIYPDAADTRNINIYTAYMAEKAAWITHPDAAGKEDLIIEFVNTFQVGSPCEIIIHVSADQRYELSLDGEFFAAGPDRSDLEHWSFSSWKISLSEGAHTFRCLQWHFGLKGSPSAQITLKPGFLFACSNENLQEKLNTGNPGSWLAALRTGLRFDPALPGIITPAPILNVREFLCQHPFVEPVITSRRIDSDCYGCLAPNWRLYPSELPEQFQKVRMKGIGRVRAVYSLFPDPAEEYFITQQDMDNPMCGCWQEMIDGGEAVIVPPNTSQTVLVDLEDYFCGYTLLEAKGGDREKIRVRWAESLYERDRQEKGNRGEVLGKTVRALATGGDHFEDLPAETVLSRHFWWRSGRFMELTVQTGNVPVTISGLGFRETRYPLEDQGWIHFGDERLDQPVKIYKRVMQMCSHETFMDCPYYEQLMYVGDSRLEALVFFMMDPGMALPLRSNLLFSWSRHSAREGLVAEHYPSHIPQLSSTFSMIWPGMVLDLLKYRRIPPGTAQRLRNGARGVLDAVSEYLNKEDLLENLPGWSFVDWVPEWNGGISKGETREEALLCNQAVRCTFNLHFLMMLQFLMELEEFEGGSQLRKAYAGEMFERVKSAVMRNFWDDERGAFMNDLEGRNDYCEHNIALAIITGILTPEQKKRAFAALLNDPALYRTTIYFKYYLFEAFRIMERADLIADHLDTWNDSIDLGAVTTWESPGKVRSDCHAWGAHPYYHYYSSIAGIRPGSFGFRSVVISPQMGKLPFVEGKMPHPDGFITFKFSNLPEGFSGEVTLPPGAAGVFHWKGKEISLQEGYNLFQC